MAVLRIIMPWANIPSTTALATVDAAGGQRDGLLAGGNVLMPSFTPATHRAQYQIYDNKNRVDMCAARLAIEAAGRSHSLGPREPAAHRVLPYPTRTTAHEREYFIPESGRVRTRRI